MILTDDKIRRMGEAIALYKPLGEVQKAFHKSKASIKWLFGGNQSSKSYTNMMDLALILLDMHPTIKIPKGTHWAAIESWQQVKEILYEEYLQKFIPEDAILPNGISYIGRGIPSEIKFKNGHVLQFKAFNQGREIFQGRSIDTIHCDEQCLKYDFVSILNEMQMRIMKKKGFISWSMTPIEPQPDLEERIENLPDTDIVFKCNLNDNRVSRGGYIPDEEIDAMIAQWPEETQATRIAGDFGSYFGAVFKTYNRETHVINPFRIPSDWRRYRAFDFGFTNPFVCLWLAKDNDENWYVYREHYKAQTGIQDHIKRIKLLSTGERYVGNIADPENAEDRNELKKAGIITKAAKKSISKGIEIVQSKLKVKANGKPSLHIFKTCRNMSKELAAYHYPKGTSTKDPKDEPVKKNDHTVDALRYAIYTIDGDFKKGSVYTAA